MVVTILTFGAIALGASSASAAGANALIRDASDGVVDGAYSASTTRAALAVVRGDPAYAQYSDVEGVLVDYLAAVTHAGTPGPKPTSTSGGSSGTSAGGKPTGTAKPWASTKPGETPGPPAPPPAPTPVCRCLRPQTGAHRAGRVSARAVPWLFALAGVGIVAGVVIVRRRTK